MVQSRVGARAGAGEGEGEGEGGREQIGAEPRPRDKTGDSIVIRGLLQPVDPTQVIPALIPLKKLLSSTSVHLHADIQLTSTQSPRHSPPHHSLTLYASGGQ